MREFDIPKEIFAMRILCHGHIPFITMRRFYGSEGRIFYVKISGFESICILMRLKDREKMCRSYCK